MIPTLPLHARNRLAALILEALGDEASRRRLAGLARDDAAGERALGLDDAGDRERLRARARAATIALEQLPLRSPRRSVADALDAAAVLFDAGLYFEVHELLEPHWLVAGEGVRESLQGLIQIAVGYQHAVNGNLAGARTLVAEGTARLGDRVEDVELVEFRRDVVAWATAMPTLAWDRVPAFPRGLRRAADLSRRRRQVG